MTTNGAVIDRKDVDGKIRVYADNVTIKRSRIRHASGFGVEVMAGARNVRVEYVEIRGTTDDRSSQTYEFRHEFEFGGGPYARPAPTARLQRPNAV